MADNGDRWLKKQEEADLDYKNGFAAGIDNDPDESSESPDWTRGRDDGKKWANPASVTGETYIPGDMHERAR